MNFSIENSTIVFSCLAKIDHHTNLKYFFKLHNEKAFKVTPLLEHVISSIQHNQLDTQIYDVHGMMYNFWTVYEYDEIVRVARLAVEDEGGEEMDIEIDQENLFTDLDSDYDESDESDVSENDADAAAVIETRGLKTECPLNVLESFHCVEGFPFDIM